MHPHDTTFRIYALSDPHTGEVRYVGITHHSLEQRLYYHLSEARSGSSRPVLDWINELSRCGLTPSISLLEETTDGRRERHWIALYRTHTSNLLNRRSGGASRQKRGVALIERSCRRCGVTFFVRLAYANRGNGQYCGKSCFNKSNKNFKRIDPPATVRFWSNVTKTESCWLWVGTGDQNGYGNLQVNGRHMKAHRFSWILHRGPIPTGLGVLHNCPTGDNPACVNPDHLWLGTAKDNYHDMVAKGRWKSGEKPKGERHWKAKLTDAQVLAIRARRQMGGITHQQLADEYGVSRSLVKQIVMGLIWRHL